MVGAGGYSSFVAGFDPLAIGLLCGILALIFVCLRGLIFVFVVLYFRQMCGAGAGGRGGGGRPRGGQPLALRDRGRVVAVAGHAGSLREMLERAPRSSPTAKPPRAHRSPRHAASSTRRCLLFAERTSSSSSYSPTMGAAGRRGGAPDGACAGASGHGGGAGTGVGYDGSASHHDAPEQDTAATHPRCTAALLKGAHPTKIPPCEVTSSAQSCSTTLSTCNPALLPSHGIWIGTQLIHDTDRQKKPRLMKHSLLLPGINREEMRFWR